MARNTPKVTATVHVLSDGTVRLNGKNASWATAHSEITNGRKSWQKAQKASAVAKKAANTEAQKAKKQAKIAKIETKLAKLAA